MTADEATQALLSVLGVIMKMSDDAEALGGARSIAGVASLHKLQNSLQKNGPRIAKIAQALLPQESA
jgi:hypothetical protein